MGSHFDFNKMRLWSMCALFLTSILMYHGLTVLSNNKNTIYIDISIFNIKTCECLLYFDKVSEFLPDLRRYTSPLGFIIFRNYEIKISTIPSLFQVWLVPRDSRMNHHIPRWTPVRTQSWPAKWKALEVNAGGKKMERWDHFELHDMMINQISIEDNVLDFVGKL